MDTSKKDGMVTRYAGSGVCRIVKKDEKNQIACEEKYVVETLKKQSFDLQHRKLYPLPVVIPAEVGIQEKIPA